MSIYMITEASQPADKVYVTAGTYTYGDLSLAINPMGGDVTLAGLKRKPITIPLWVLGDLRTLLAVLDLQEPHMFDKQIITEIRGEF